MPRCPANASSALLATVVAVFTGSAALAGTADPASRPGTADPAAASVNKTDAKTKHKDADVVLMSATRLRALAIETPSLIVADLDRMPPGIFERTEPARKVRAQVWSLFFSGTVLKAGGLSGDYPVTLFLNPLADVAVLQYCDRTPSGELACLQTCAITGERLAPVRKQKPHRAPEWTAAEFPVEQLTKNARGRLASFAERFPLKSMGAKPEQLCSPQEQVAAEIRLVDLMEAVSRVKPAALSAALECATTGKPACSSQMIADAQTRQRVIDLTRSKGGVAVTGVIHSAGQMKILVVPKLSAWQLGMVTVREEAHDKYAFNSLSFFAL